MILLNPDDVKDQLNNCYNDYNPKWKQNLNQLLEDRDGFKDYLKRTAGIQMDYYVAKSDNALREHYYKINSMYVIDEQLYTLWLIKWA